MHLFTFGEWSCFLESTMPHFGRSWWCFLHVHIFLFLTFYTPKTRIFLFNHGHDFNNKMFEKLLRDGLITKNTWFSFASLVPFNSFAVSGKLWQWMVPKLLNALLCMGSWFETCIFAYGLDMNGPSDCTPLTIGLFFVAGDFQHFRPFIRLLLDVFS